MNMTECNLIDGRTLLFTFDHLPPAPLRPNARVHWGRKARLTKSARQYAWAVGRQLRRYYGRVAPHERALRAKMPDMPFGKSRITFVFQYPTAHRRDIDNFVAAMKPYIDGLVDAGVLADDSSEQLSHGAHNHCISRATAPNGQVNVYITPLR